MYRVEIVGVSEIPDGEGGVGGSMGMRGEMHRVGKYIDGKEEGSYTSDPPSFPNHAPFIPISTVYVPIPRLPTSPTTSPPLTGLRIAYLLPAPAYILPSFPGTPLPIRHNIAHTSIRRAPFATPYGRQLPRSLVWRTVSDCQSYMREIHAGFLDPRGVLCC